MTPKYLISIIIPVLNEAAIIESTLERLTENPHVEIIVVDGGSSDRTVDLAQQMTGVTVIIVANLGRAAQMNAGAAMARGKYLLFLHVDTRLPVNYSELVRETLIQPEVIAGAFELGIDSQAKSLRLVEFFVKMRSHLCSLPYGDQAIFLTKKVFVEIGGFPDLPIMEDFELIQRLKSQGKIAIAPAKIITSPRRWQKLGVWRTTLINQLVIFGYYLGISPVKLKNFYRGSQKKRQGDLA
ncbi:MAG: TIGR04283 family arsenosugar biosynthesis glycosyltransferase [Pleurocapsa sp.]